MLGEWHYRILDQEFGPVSLDIIQELVQADQLLAHDLVKRAAREPWQRADTYSELFPDVSLFTLHSDVTPSGHPASESGSPAWYCLADGQLYGPVGFDLLRQWASDKRLLPDHLVREETSELWTEAGSIERLFDKTTMEPAPPLTNPSPEEICDILREAPRPSSDRAPFQVTGAENVPMTLEKTADGSDEPASTAPCDDTAFGETELPLASGASSTSNGRDNDDAVLVQNHTEGWTAGVKRRPGRRLLLVSFACVIGAMIAVMLFGNPDRRRYRMMVNIWSQMQQLEQQGADQSEWKTFTERTHQQLDPVLRELKRSDNAAGQHLLVAGQELLETIHFHARGQDPFQAAEDFQWQMARVAELLAGQPELDEAPVPTTRRPDEKLDATTRLYLPMMLHGKTFVSGSYVWNVNFDRISDVEIHKIVPADDGWYEAVVTVTASDDELLYDLRAEVKVRYHLPSGSLGTAAGMQTIPYGQVTVLSIEPLEQPADVDD